MFPIQPELKILDTKTTLQHCYNAIIDKHPGCYLRFGDGDIFLLYGKNDMLQVSDAQLQREMLEAFQCNGPFIFKALPIHSSRFGYEEGMEDGVHLCTDNEAEQRLRQCAEFFLGTPIYSPVALHHQAVINPEFTISFLKVLREHATLFIGSQTIPNNIITLLFKNCVHIKTPPKNAYQNIEIIYRETTRYLKQEKFSVIVTAMGCAGRILSKRLIKNNINCFIFDFGSLIDAISGYESRTWIKKTNIIKKLSYIGKNINA